MNETKRALTVYDATYNLLRKLGLTTIFGNPGSTEQPFLKNFPPDFEYVLGLQEATAMAMADGFAQATGKPALLNLHSCAGTGHGMGNIMTAFQNKTPLIITAGQQTREMILGDPYLTNRDETTLPRPRVTRRTPSGLLNSRKRFRRARIQCCFMGNDPFVVQSVQHTSSTNGDVYGVATELFTFGKKFAFLANVGVRGTNAQKYGYGGNTLDWEARAFVGLAFPIPVKKAILIAPTIEVDQEPRYIKYVPTAHLPTDLIYAVRVSRYPNSKWTFDVGTGHVGATLAQGINIKVNNAIAFAADFRF